MKGKKNERKNSEHLIPFNLFSQTDQLNRKTSQNWIFFIFTVKLFNWRLIDVLGLYKSHLVDSFAYITAILIRIIEPFKCFSEKNVFECF